MQAARQSIFGGELVRMVKGKSDGLKVLDFCPEYINNGFNGFIDHIQVGTGILMEFHINLFTLQTLRSCKQINAVKAYFRLYRKGPSSNCTVMYQILASFLPQHQHMRTMCKLFPLQFHHQCCCKRGNVRDNMKQTQSRKTIITFHFLVSSTLHFHSEHPLCNQTPPPTLHLLPQ